MGATALTARPPCLSSLRFLSATLLFPPTTLVPPHPCKVRTCRTDLTPAPLLPLSRVFPEEETHSQSSFSSTCLQQPLAWLSRFLDLSPQCQGNSGKPRLTSATKTIHFINCNYVPIISKGSLSKIPPPRHAADYQLTHFFHRFGSRNWISSQESLPNLMSKRFKTKLFNLTRRTSKAPVFCAKNLRYLHQTAFLAPTF